MAAALALGFLLMPVLEIYVIIQVGQVIGAWWTVFLLLAESALGAWLVRREGVRTWRRLGEAMRSGRMPDRELADGAMVLVGGALLLTPGFVTDVAGFWLLLPPARPLTRRLLRWLVSRRVRAATRSGRIRVVRLRGQQPPPPGRVVRGEVVDGPEPGPSDGTPPDGSPDP